MIVTIEKMKMIIQTSNKYCNLRWLFIYVRLSSVKVHTTNVLDITVCHGEQCATLCGTAQVGQMKQTVTAPTAQEHSDVTTQVYV